MFERFTANAKETVKLAQENARHLGHNYVGTEHLLLGLLQVPDGTAARVLGMHGVTGDFATSAVVTVLGDDPAHDTGLDAEALESIGIDLEAVRQKVEAAFGPGALDPPGRRCAGDRGRRGIGGHIPFTPRAKKVLELSLREALRLEHKSITDSHVLLGLLREGDGLAAKVLADAGIDFADLRHTVEHELGAGA